MNESLTTLRDIIDINKLHDKLLTDGKLSESTVQEKAGMIRSCAATLIATVKFPSSLSIGVLATRMASAGVSIGMTTKKTIAAAAVTSAIKRTVAITGDTARFFIIFFTFRFKVVISNYILVT